MAGASNPLSFAHLTHRGQIARLRRLAEYVLPCFGIEYDSISLMVVHLHNTTFVVTDHAGRRYVLHLVHSLDPAIAGSQTPASVRSELWWLDRLRTDLEICAPVTIRTPEGEGVIEVALEGAEPHRLSVLFEWVYGRFVYHRLTPAHLAAVGRLTAQMHDHSNHLQVPAGFDRPQVASADAETEDEMVRIVGNHLSMEASAVVRKVFRRVRQAQDELGYSPDTFGVIHADIHQHNYLFHGRQVRLIDFGDCGWGHYLYDLAVTVDQLGALPRRHELRVALLAGYREIRALPPAYERLIDTFVMLRQCQDIAWLPMEQRDSKWVTRALRGIAVLERSLCCGT